MAPYPLDHDHAFGGACVIEITLFRKADGTLTKSIDLAEDGTIRSDGSACLMTSGKAGLFTFDSIEEFAGLLVRLSESEAIALGALRPEQPTPAEITTAGKLGR